MKNKLFVVGILVLLLSISTSLAMACNCGKKINGNQSSSCQSQCASGCGGQSACSEGSSQLTQGEPQGENKENESKAVEVGNKICPVSGQKVGEMGEVIKYEYNGKIYNLCCPACVKDFKKDPEKYSTIADEEAKEIQTDPHKDHNHNNS